MENCPFCKIDDVKTRIIKERQLSYVLFSNPRLMPGHLLIIPKRHVVKPFELNEEERREIFNTIIEYQEKILKNISSGCDVRHNYRPFQKDGQIKQSHLHFHLLPRELYDDYYERCHKYETEIFQPLTKKEFEEISRKLK